MNKKILVVGSLNMDMIVQMERLPIEGETVLGGHLQYIPGGKGANQACAAASLGGDVTMLGCVGHDEFGQIQLEGLKKRNVKTKFLRTVESNNTGTAIIYLNDSGNNCIVVVQGANLQCDIDYLKGQEQKITECDILLVQMEIPYESIYYVIEKARKEGKTVILNPAPAPDMIPDEILSKIDFLTPNETELMKLTGTRAVKIEEIRESAEELLKKGVKNVIVTLGERGALFVNGEKCELYPTDKVEVVDTTAAGDCFNGALATALAEGRTVGEAIVFANKASSIAVTREGAQTSIPAREEINEKRRI